MRMLFAALALAGALSLFVAAPDPRLGWLGGAAAAYASEPPEPRILAQAGTTAADVARAKRCAPPLGCKRIKRPKLPPPDFRSSIAAILDAAAADAGVPVALARALVRVESGGNPSLRGRQGEWGLTQIKCQTARGLGFAGSCAALADAAINLRWGLKHARLALARGSIGFHQAGLGARRVSAAYVGKINAAMR